MSIRPVSKSRAPQLARYRKLRADFLEESKCKACFKIWKREPIPATQVHHTRGRVGRLLCEAQYWLAVCHECHEWITNHTAKARELGLVCELGKWNTYE